MAHTVVQGSYSESLTVQVAELFLNEKTKVRQQMIKDGFQDTWGPHRQSEWVLKEITGTRKQRKYAAVLCRMWVEQSKQRYYRQPYHPAAQDRLPTEAKQG